MAKTRIHNNTNGPITLPPPYTGIVPGGVSVVVDDPVSVVVQALVIVPELFGVLTVDEVPAASPVDGNTRAAAASAIAEALGNLSGDLDLNGQRIINMADPSDPQDAATKQYVDLHAGGGSGTVQQVNSGTGLLGGPILVSGTLSVDFGDGAGKVVEGTNARLVESSPGVTGAVVYDTGAAYSKTAAGTPGQVLKVGSGGEPEWGDDSTTPTGAAGGSLAGTYPNPTIAAGAITNTEVAVGAAIETSKIAGLLTDIAGNGLAAFVDASTKVARTYYVAANGSDLNDGSISKPFATVQAAHDEAASEYTGGEYVAIEVGPGSFSGNVTITRKNTLIQGAGHRAEMFATTLLGSVTFNPTSATQKFTDLVGIAGCFVSNSSAAPAVKASGSGLYSLIVNDCYLYSNNSNTTAAAFACDATNPSRPRVVINDSVIATDQAGPNPVQLDRGDVRMNNTQIRHNSGVTSGALGSGVAVLNDATLWLNGCLVETRTRESGILATGAAAGIKLLLTNTGVTTAYAGAENTTHGITVGNTAGVAAFLYQVSFNVADVSAGVYAVNNSGAAVVSYGELSFQYGTNTAIAPAVLAAALPMTETHATMVLPSLSASLPLKLDANKIVKAEAISLSGSEVTGTLPVGRGGTGVTTTPPAGAVAHGNGSTLAYTAVGTAGEPLLSNGTGAPSFGAVSLAGTAVTGTLPKGKQEAQDVGGDLSGTTAAATVTHIQNRPVDATAPTAGQVYAWSGSAWAPATVEAGGGGGGGGGGLTYYLNYGIAGESPLPDASTKQLALEYDTGGQVNTGAVTAPDGTYATLAEFVTDLSLPGETTIPPGNWDVAAYLVQSNANHVFFRARVYKWDGTTLTELSTSPSDDVAVTESAIPTLFTASVYIEQAVLTATDRIVIRLEITRNTASPRSVTAYFGGNTPAHAHTTLGAPGGTGLVKVVDGIVQAPAELLFNSDVDAAAAIEVSKLESGAVASVLHGGSPNYFGKVQLDSEVAGILPVPNGGTGLSAGTSGGVPYFDSTTTMASSAALAQHELMLGGGVGGAPSTLGDLGTTTKVLHGNASGNPTWGAVSLSADVTGTLPVANGGTNTTAIGPAGSVAYSTGGAYDFSLQGSAGDILTSGGNSTPVWVSVLPYTHGGTGSTATPTANQVPYGNTLSDGLVYTTGGAPGEVLGIGLSGSPEWMSNGSAPIGPAGGDLSSSYPDPTVAKINGASVPAAGTLTVGQVLKVSAGSALTYGPLDLSNVDAVTGTLSVYRGGTGSSIVSPNHFLGGPTAGLSEAPSFRELHINDMPAQVVRTTGSYANPSWITSLAGTKISGNISGNAANVTGTVAASNGGTGITTAPAVGELLVGDGTNYDLLPAGADGTYLVNSGAGNLTWATIPAPPVIPYDVAGAIVDKPTSGDTIFRFVATRAFTLSATGSNHVFKALIPATGSATFTVYRNADVVGTATFGAGDNTATLASVANNVISVGDLLTVDAPLSQDATLADVFFTLTGSV